MIIDKARRFQLRVGMEGLDNLEYVPAHRSAYALRMPLKDGHATVEEANREQDALVAWLHATTSQRRRNARVSCPAAQPS